MARTVEADGPHPVDRHVGRRIAERRVTLGFNQSELGKALGLTFQQVQKYEKGANRVSASKLWETAKFLGVDTPYFFDGLPDGDLAHGVSEDHEVFSYGNLNTRESMEIARLAPTLSTRQQKLFAELLKTMLQADPEKV